MRQCPTTEAIPGAHGEIVDWLTPIDETDVRELLQRRIDAAGPHDDDAREVAAHLDEIVGLLERG